MMESTKIQQGSSGITCSVGVTNARAGEPSVSSTTISRVDHRTPVVLAFSDFCIAHHVVISKHVLGGTIRITQGTSIQRGITSETVASHSDVSQVQKGAIISTPGSLTETSAVDVETNIIAQQLFAGVESVTNYDVSVSFS